MIDVNAAVIHLNGVENSEAEDIKSCLLALYGVREGEQPLDRDFGLNHDFIDQPVSIAKNMLALEVINKTHRYEKRVKVEKVEYEEGKEGQLIPVICLRKG